MGQVSLVKKLVVAAGLLVVVAVGVVVMLHLSASPWEKRKEEMVAKFAEVTVQLTGTDAATANTVGECMTKPILEVVQNLKCEISDEQKVTEALKLCLDKHPEAVFSVLNSAVQECFTAVGLN